MKSHNDMRKIALDSQSYSYLIDAICGLSEPTDSLAEERKALLRIWFYTDAAFIITETVKSEFMGIANPERKDVHKSFCQSLFADLAVVNRQYVQKRSNELMKNHNKRNDCQILAEAEDIRAKTLLTYDRKFKRRLNSESSSLSLEMPSEYWNKLNIAKNTTPLVLPRPDNPLSKEKWWRW